MSRLSREDELLGDSESITTQKSMLEQYAIRNRFTNIVHYVDDGFSDYDSIEELNIKLLNDFINKIIIHERERINGKRHQKMTIIFRYTQEEL